ncbi:DUF1579 family protein [Sphingosinicella sp. LHD-64]|uniref:DUF1579 family protein n=1 Tax=Sphingosinicella sp. LHD-64 TaxID=3072139 RepID=UPI00281074DB|nr:DUF1579 family protein [Sphingosinicella sp. LHD-64]MDQ8757752.1 DUF1579 family protein [Sphingosinicella sp. LHD-64]
MKSFVLVLMLVAAVSAIAQPAPTANDRLNAAGPEARSLAERTGTWEVVATFWPAPGAQPVVTQGLVAERRMVGSFLEERMMPGGDGPAFTRIDYLGFNRVEGRWQYVSLDTRLPVGIMPATSFDRGDPDRLSLVFEPLAFAGFGDTVEGRMMRADLTISREGPDREVKEQRFVFASGDGTPWRAVRYEYRRRRQ